MDRLGELDRRTPRGAFTDLAARNPPLTRPYCANGPKSPSANPFAGFMEILYLWTSESDLRRLAVATATVGRE